MKNIRIEGVGEVELKKSARAKRLILKINQSGKPIVTIPDYVPYIVAEKFAYQHIDWFKQHISTKTELIIHEGKRIGKIHTVHYQAKNVAKPTSRISSDSITISYPQEVNVAEYAVQIEANKASVRALRRQAERYLPPMLYNLASKYGYEYREVRIKAVQTRWGSCSSNRIINLSIWLMQLPHELTEYVLCHELTHLSNMNHSPEFWAELSKMIPDYKLKKLKLKKFSPKLM